jgi:hypothetical protein
LWKAFPAYLTHLWNSCQCQSPHLLYQCAGMGIPVHIPSVKWLHLNVKPIPYCPFCQMPRYALFLICWCQCNCKLLQRKCILFTSW